ncbi:hypothetical protein HRI_002405500 [Hibiscus trionum]|uniref:Uncharacterized protein n=1 Tax=Hibiscus trionum TaxID=183268 RepID=A0A9W7M2N6_HIBTR|nr:hypothetical protein HRI_002405500 [Hibiscus trionum]
MAQNHIRFSVPRNATVQIFVNHGHWPNGQQLPPAPPQHPAPPQPPKPPQHPAPPLPPKPPLAPATPYGSSVHSIYKEKAALIVEPRAPEFVPLDSGTFKISREGFVLLQFAPAAGVRQYDWGKKQVFSLSVTEIGTLITLSTTQSCEFVHDQLKGKSDEGKVRKVLKVEPLPDGSGHFFNLGVEGKLLNMDESFYIPITRAEFSVLKSSFSFLLPYLLGCHAFAS